MTNNTHYTSTGKHSARRTEYTYDDDTTGHGCSVAVWSLLAIMVVAILIAFGTGIV